MPCANTSFLKAEDVCTILDACSRNGVRELKFLGLEVSLGKPVSVLEPELAPGPINPATNPEHVIQVQASLETESQTEQELATRDLQIAELLITDPLAAEQLMESGELVPGDDKDVDDDGADD